MAQLEQAWSTGQMQPGKALSYWKDVICENLLEMHIRTANEAEFHGDISKCTFGPLKANFIAVSEQHVWRTGPRTRVETENVFHLIHVRKGVQLVEQYGRQLRIEAGNCLLVDCLASFDFNFPQGVEALVLEISRDWIRGWLPAPEEAAAQVIDATTGWGATLASALGNITLTSIAALGLPQAVVAEQIVVLLALAAAPECPTLTTHKRSLLRRVKETLRERCHETELNPAAVAASLGLSRRYIHVLFAAVGTTFTQELYACRLQRAERLLRDKRFASSGIAEIGWNSGFSEPSHFTRRFRERFGVPPTAYRQSADCTAST
jgi:AraC family transcriptional regulator, positive regulator of tynA and feaB